MTETIETKKNNTEVSEEIKTEAVPVVVKDSKTTTPDPKKARGTYAPKGAFKKNIRARSNRSKFERPKPEFDQKIIDIRRVTRVVKGGRRFSFSVAMILGNKKGSVGVGIGKASDTALGIEKAMRDAKKNMIKLKLTKDMSIPYEVKAKYCSSEVVIRPAKGRGVVAGSSVRNVLELAGITEVGGKILSRSKNKLNNAKVAIKALSEFKSV
ncbi:30S ribosomal protein S5 [Patescibacteria group bacterium]|nr:30S ribosomal protein S5 [Patescibacteria group bacterium]MCG2694988.1 30S ribosomal protein S5 [Candidatus Parcubacteria bacterium]